MPTSVPRGAPFLLLPPLLMLSAVLAVPVDRPHQEDSQATETPVSSSSVFAFGAVAFAIPRALVKIPGIPCLIRRRGLWFTHLPLQS